MTRSDLLTVGTARTVDSIAAGSTRWTCDDESYWTTVTSPSTAPVPARTAGRRAPTVRDSRRPDAGSVEYLRRSNGVSQVEHGTRQGHGVASAVAVALITAMSVLGLVGLANVRAADAPVQPSVSQQADMGVTATR